MDGLYFSSTSFLSMALSGGAMILLPAALFLILRLKAQTPVKPFFIGAAVFMVFAILLKAPVAYLICNSGTELSRTVNSEPLLSYGIAGLLAGIFEESGRLIAFKTLLKNDREKKTALAYGLGHGGMECVYLGINMLSLIALGIIVNSGNTSELLSSVSPDQLETAKAQIQGYAALTPLDSFLGIVERIFAMLLQLSLSVVVFKAAEGKKKLPLFFVAVLIHSMIDFMIILTTYGMPVWILEIIFFAAALLFFVVTYRLIWKKAL